MSIVQLTGFIIVPESDLEAVTSELPNHIRLTCQEPGCLSFSIEQSAFNPCRFDVAEKFQDRESFNQHQLRVKASYWGKVTTNIDRHYEIREKECSA